MIGNYPLHLMILVLLWGYIYTSWSLMGRLGLVSFGHGAFMGIGAYTVVMLWNHFGWSPWAGALAALAFAAAVAVVIGYPCFRFRIVGHYFALVTLALSEVARLVIVALRDQTGGSLGATPNSALHGWAAAAPGALQCSDKLVWFWIVLAFWLAGLWVWRAVDRSMARLALQAISEEEEAAASIGIHVARAKLRITLISALMTCAGGVLYAQYQLYVNPDTVSGIGISLQMVFGAIAGGMFVMLGPTVGAAFTLLLAEGHPRRRARGLAREDGEADSAQEEQRHAQRVALPLARLRAQRLQHQLIAGQQLAAAGEILAQALLALGVHRLAAPAHVLLEGAQARELGARGRD